MSETIELPVRAKHFKGTSFINFCDCAIAKAAKDKLETNDVHETGSAISINGKYYKHMDYGAMMFNKDKKLAATKKYSNTIIRTITLTPL